MRRRWLDELDPRLALAAPAALAIFSSVVLVGSQLSERRLPKDLLGVRLGMAPGQLAANFRDAHLGTFHWEEASQYQVAHWERATASVPTISTQAARFVFHDGLLTAVQLKVDDDTRLARGASFESTESTLLTRKRSAAAVTITLTLRSCTLNETAELVALKSRWLEDAAIHKVGGAD